MVIRVMSDLFKVIVLSADTKTLLTIRHPMVLCRCIAKEPLLELVHTGICEH